MIFVSLQGGLGNQLFQYAAAKALAERKRERVYLDTGKLVENISGVTQRKYQLGAFNISGKIATEKQLEKVRQTSITRKLHNKVLPYYKKKIYIEPFFQFDKNFFKASSPVLLQGYWQSEKYFKHISGSIRHSLKVTAPLSAATRQMAAKIKSSNAVSIHIRRGDYVNDPETQKVHGSCGIDYYKKAISIIAEKFSSIHLFVFSDDINWAKENLPAGFPVEFADHTDADHAYEDLYLMSLCNHNIIANSSFSWWGAWLNNHAGKMVITPAKWFNEKEADTKDLFPEGWIVI